ncbi:helix-turn-helix transcriptional regulator [Paenibacillus sp. UNC451MF]|uniref:helix-turn-helix transcriptional regulator n=1 Tax=Paenibacillus sp. UNC451MF TaxID=1449063 RepID=UPI00048ECF55|nr:WYL domain-containing protein [Paenibacillus sp. UNC451MF]
MSKADNMLSILWLLKKGKRLTAKQLAEELEMNIRTVYRYIDALCASGVPIIADSGHNGGYSLLERFNEAPLFFDMSEQKALIQAAVFAREAGYPYGEALQRAVDKLKLYTNDEQLNELNRHLVGFDVIHAPQPSSQEWLLQELEMSVANGCTMAVEYLKGNADSTNQREVDPYGLVYWRGKWYIVAYCHLREEIRSFRVDRIHSLIQTENRFDRPHGFSAREFFMSTLLPDIDNQENLMLVRIEGKEQSINDLSQHWLLSYVMVERTATEIQYRLDEKSVATFLPHLLLPYGRSIRIMEPSLLQERLVAVTTALLDYYQKM